MSVMNIELPSKMHRCLSATAAAKGVTIKAAVIEATSLWLNENACHLAALSLSPAQPPPELGPVPPPPVEDSSERNSDKAGSE
jgi:hypothetical protein